MQHLSCGYQPYEWGKKGASSKVAQVVGAAADPANAEKPFAELWIGAHPSKPSRIAASQEPLSAFVKAHADAAVSAAHKSRFGDEVPFLLKILSIGKALSIQAHPDKGRAAVLHAKDPKNYPDPNHKPELIVALTPMEALCCFRRLAEIQGYVRSVPQLAELLGAAAVDALLAADGATASRDVVRSVVQPALDVLYHKSAEEVARLVTARREALLASGGALSLTDSIFVRISGEFPGDVGCWMVYFLNAVSLVPGEALFLSQNEPHAYLCGDGVEVMASSDNVVRAGLTPKFKDVGTLLEMMTYDTDGLAQARHELVPGAVQYYNPPSWCTEFSLVRVALAAAGSVSVSAAPSLVLAVVTEGEGTLGDQPIKAGDCFFVPASTAAAPLSFATASSLAVFCASTAGWKGEGATAGAGSHL